MIGVHDHLKPTWRSHALAVHGLPDRIDVGCAGLADGLRPHPKPDVSRFHLIIGGLVPLFVEVRPHLDECVVFCRLDGLEVVPRRHVPGELSEVHVAQLTFADGERHERYFAGVDLLLDQLSVQVSV